MSADTSGGFGYPRWTPPIPPVPRKRMPTLRATDEEPADGGRADVARDGARSEVTGTDLARVGREPRELLLGEADADAAVEHAGRRRHRAGSAHRAIALEPDLHAGGSGKAVRDECRLERDHGRAVLECRAHLVGELDQLVHAREPSGIAPRCWTQRAAASSARSGPPTIQPAARASPAPVESTTFSTGSASRSSPSNEQPRAPRLRIQAASTDRPADHALLVLVREHDVGVDGANRLAERLDAAVADRAPRGEIDADPRALGACELGRAQGGAPHGLHHERVAGDVEVIAAREPARVDVVRAELARSAAVGRHRAARRPGRRGSRSSRCGLRPARRSRPRRRRASPGRARRRRPHPSCR